MSPPDSAIAPAAGQDMIPCESSSYQVYSSYKASWTLSSSLLFLREASSNQVPINCRVKKRWEEDRCRCRDLKLKDGGAVRKESSRTADLKTYLSPSMQPPDLGLRGRWEAQAETPSQISTWAKASNQ
ncbi:hypothetical protein LINPERPRIM_LOCUS11301 [Linum perenne]